MWTMWVANLAMIILTLIKYGILRRNRKVKSQPLRLFEKLPSVTIGEKLLAKDSDLGYLMELVYTNRSRLQYVTYDGVFCFLGTFRVLS